MQATRLFTILLVAFLFSATASAQVFDSGPSDPSLFESVVNLPGDEPPERVGGSGDSAQLNVASGGSVGDNVGLFVLDGGEVNISGGSVGGGLFASGGEVNISGGSAGNNLNARGGSMVNISGGSVGDFFRGQGGAEINISGGSVEDNFEVSDGCEVNISGGSVGHNFKANDGSAVNISGGSVGTAFGAYEGSIVNLFGSDFVLDGVLLDDLVAGEAFTILDRNVTLSGLLADGSAFSFDLNSQGAGNANRFELDAVLTVTLADSFFLCTREVPDQEFMPPGYMGITLTTGGDDQTFAAVQTFTVGREGNLSRVELLISYIAGFDPVPTDGLDVEILANLDLASTPTRLGLVHVPHSMIPTSAQRRAGQRLSVDLTSLEIAVEQGDVLGIAVSSPSKESYAWYDDRGYGGGQNFSMFDGQLSQGFGDVDYGFRTFVNPSCLLLGDCNLDGTIDFLDIGPFILFLTTGEFQAEADVFEDGVISFLDIQPFIDILSGQ